MRKNEISIGDAIRYFIEDHNFQERVLESQAIEAWEQQTSEQMKKYTRQIFMRKRILYVQISAPSIVQELDYGKNRMRELINETLGLEFVKDIKFI
ncbi:MAG: DciA family protein [Weeksellaceae bacterium]|nr:DciA family protein [Weeksellaceae bacterium]